MSVGIEKKTELSLAIASEALNRMLVGAYLDCLSVSSIQVSLRFINAEIFPGNSLYVDSNFSCDAVMDNADYSAMDDSAEGFFTRRAKFLADVYSCIGREVKNVYLEVDGSLSISIGDSVMVMQLAKEDKEQEESVWMVEMETPPGHLMSAVNSVMCVPKDGGISFLS